MHLARMFAASSLLVIALPLAAADMPSPLFHTSLVSSYDSAANKIVQLANAFTDEQLAWRPAEGVRSTREAILHVVGANYFLGSKLGAKIPEGVNPGEIEKFMGGGAELVAMLQKSSDFVRAAVNAVPEADLGKDMQFFGQTASEMRFMFILAEHAHEHLGQLIAYARANGVKPPWSQ